MRPKGLKDTVRENPAKRLSELTEARTDANHIPGPQVSWNTGQWATGTSTDSYTKDYLENKFLDYRFLDHMFPDHRLHWPQIPGPHVPGTQAPWSKAPWITDSLNHSVKPPFLFLFDTVLCNSFYNEVWSQTELFLAQGAIYEWVAEMLQLLSSWITEYLNL